MNKCPKALPRFYKKVEIILVCETATAFGTPCERKVHKTKRSHAKIGPFYHHVRDRACKRLQTLTL